jgi:hypothetical protein
VLDYIEQVRKYNEDANKRNEDAERRVEEMRAMGEGVLRRLPRDQDIRKSS